VSIITYTCPECSHTTDVLPGVLACGGCDALLPVTTADGENFNDTRPPDWAAEYFNDCRSLLGIDDAWDLWLLFVANPRADADGDGDEDTDADNDADGICCQESRYLKATIRVKRGLSQQRTRSVIMHELLHVAFAPLVLAAERTRDLIPDRLRIHAYQLHIDAEEQVIERLTRALQRGVKPPPPEEKTP